ncbi:sulfurtransferase [Leucobacter aridicollis]|uniref:sulfurtransferase n=1 Tax=Leucobacter aridicollis TaxID=283878 RepID=UPI000E65869E|nr:sulfurtransferase [Leucobacter aridicollis]UTX53250.1 sulfurtransferase [Leucobacter aridicollis]
MSDPTDDARRDLLVTPAELHDILQTQALAGDGPRTRVLDVRWTLTQPSGHSDYRSGHIPGAVYVDLESELSAHGVAELGRHPLPGGEALTHSARRWGLHPDDSVVAYDGGGNLASARLWWLLRDAGFDRVRLLDGALPAWIGAGFALETTEPSPAPGTVILTPGHLPTLALEDVGQFAQEHVLFDVRAPERYRGDVEPMDPIAGHIPGAINLPTSENLDDAGRFLPTEALRARFSLEAATGSGVGFSCGSGITASHALFAFALTGGNGALFPGSWSQWANTPDMPVATGSTP